MNMEFAISGPASGSRYTETYYNWSILDIRGQYRIVEACIHMKIAINVYEYQRGRCVYKLSYTYALNTKREMPKEKENRHMSKVTRISIGTVT